MTIIRLLTELHDDGIYLSPNGDRIRIESTRGNLPAAVVQRVADHKPELIAFMSSTEGEMLRTLLDLAIDDGMTAEALATLEPPDLAGCVGLPRDSLRTYLRMVARRLGMAAGIVPSGWESAAECAMCGPVLLWPGAPATVTACGWCVHRKAGRVIPRPAGRMTR